ncbi:MAG: phosphoadenosine phosphosulfate reductase family protein, partial [Armatimonadetes bacterium]|nr:phosphoadenosine phosphosulfate reductase family protein [Armatimonadota bacterium]
GKVLVVSGLRWAESKRRSGYRRVMHDTKVGPQILVNPIIDWSDFDVWLWTLSSGAPINEAYRYGLDRVGCAVCPDQAPWGAVLGSRIYESAYEQFQQVLLDTARLAGIDDPASYVASGAWRNRRGGGIGTAGLPGAEVYDVSLSVCPENDERVTYVLKRRISLTKLAELLKVFGSVSPRIIDGQFGYYTVFGPHGDFAVEAYAETGEIVLEFRDEATKRRLAGTLRAHFRKLQACVGCGGCAALCPTGAIVSVGERFHIGDHLCTHCLKCIRAVKAGCWAAHSVNRRAGQHA